MLNERERETIKNAKGIHKIVMKAALVANEICLDYKVVFGMNEQNERKLVEESKRLEEIRGLL